MAIALVDTGYSADYSGATTNALTTITQKIQLVAGNFLVAVSRVYRGSDPGSGAVASAQVNPGGGVQTLTRATRVYFPSSDGANVEVWYRENCSTQANAYVTFTMDNSNYQYWGAVCAQYSGIATSGSFDASATGTQASGTTVTSGSFTTDTNDELLIGAATYDAANDRAWTAGSGYTIQVTDGASSNPPGNLSLQDQIVASIQTGVTADMTLDNSRNLVMVVATFRGAGGGATGQPMMRRWGGTPHMGGNVGQKGSKGGAWG